MPAERDDPWRMGQAPDRRHRKPNDTPDLSGGYQRGRNNGTGLSKKIFRLLRFAAGHLRVCCRACLLVLSVPVVTKADSSVRRRLRRATTRNAITTAERATTHGKRANARENPTDAITPKTVAMRLALTVAMNEDVLRSVSPATCGVLRNGDKYPHSMP
jgi:hypothetical protein